MGAHADGDRTDPEYGLFDWVDANPGGTVGAVYDGRLRLLVEADRCGFSRYHIAEHHGTLLGLAPSPAIFVGAAARLTQRIRLVPTTFVVPLYDPLRLAEEIGMLDQLTGGRLEIGVGRGSSPYEAEMYGLTGDQPRERFQSELPVILEALRTGYLRRPGFDEPAEIHVRVLQQPHPPLWYPTSNPDSIPRLGEQGYSVLCGFGGGSGTLEDVRALSKVFFDHFRAARTGAAPPAAEPRFGVVRHIVVAPTDEQAVALARPAFADHRVNFSYLWRRRGSDRWVEPVDFDEFLAQDMVLVGSPESVAAQVARVMDLGGLNYLACAFAWGSLDPEASLASLRLFRDEVIPAVLARRTRDEPVS
jgi:alkanesulfonate monooxygenase SsuD/methylene tetrahydromethanopterin reductase-like flavin-dependent oxidoreductase (luciferase family)